MGVDELLSVCESHVYDSEKREEFVLRPEEIVGAGAGSFDDLLPVAELDATVPHFLRLISGEGPPGALESIRLNAAALAMNCGVVQDWREGMSRAAQAMADGEPARLIERIRSAGAAPKPAATT
jgi:anthranilate phosphoribosyltransferase